MKVFALVDCNNFCASCETFFRPDFAKTPVVVLSNNDGCVVARSKEAKALGVKMGVPYFQVREIAETHGIVAFSSNYALYADMSSRVMTKLEQLAPSVKVYSIDEAILDLTDVKSFTEPTKFGKQMTFFMTEFITLICFWGNFYSLIPEYHPMKVLIGFSMNTLTYSLAPLAYFQNYQVFFLTL